MSRRVTVASGCRQDGAQMEVCGLDGANVHVYRQSRVPAVAQLASLLNNIAAKGLLNRAHAYEAAVAHNVAAGCVPVSVAKRDDTAAAGAADGHSKRGLLRRQRPR